MTTGFLHSAREIASRLGMWIKINEKFTWHWKQLHFDSHHSHSEYSLALLSFAYLLLWSTRLKSWLPKLLEERNDTNKSIKYLKHYIFNGQKAFSKQFQHREKHFDTIVKMGPKQMSLNLWIRITSLWKATDLTTLVDHEKQISQFLAVVDGDVLLFMLLQLVRKILSNAWR